MSATLSARASVPAESAPATVASLAGMPKEIPVIEGPHLYRSKRQIVAGFMPVGLLIPDGFTIPVYEYDEETGKSTGYQRAVQKFRVKKLADAIKRREVDLPTSILLNIRAEGADDHYLSNGCLQIADLMRDGEQFHIVDGQHRVQAFERLIVTESLLHFKTHPIPFICILGAPEVEEMTQFHLVNSNAKPVNIGLSWALFKQRARLDYVSEEEQTSPILEQQALTEEMALRSSEWSGLIRMPNAKKGDTVVPSSGMAKSLEPLVKESFSFSRLSTDDQIAILDAYWRAVRSIIPDAFGEGYSLRKPLGVRVMHKVLANAYGEAREQGLDVKSQDTYENFLREPLEHLSGYREDGEEIHGADFWLTGKAGGVSQYSSESGRARLARMILKKIPDEKVTSSGASTTEGE
ncbi:MAG: DGQHR domain-containing protein [Alphaproteobacteria bacterium]|nr:DGQHR domain-containing protein [Alphaproteobacteria bacterium]